MKGERTSVKQRITIEQLDELTDEQKQNLREWWDPQPSDHFTNGNAEVFYVGSLMRSPGKFITYGDDIPHEKEGLLPLISIGQMSHYLFDHTNDWGMHYNDSGVFYTVYLSWSLDIASPVQKWSKDELCDALWEATKRLLPSGI